MTATRKGKAQKRRYGLTGQKFFILAFLACVVVGTVRAEVSVLPQQNHRDLRYDISIPSLNAIEAFSRLQDQTDTDFLFPYDLAESRTTQEVNGKYTVIEALMLMLYNTGLSCDLSEKGAIRIFLSDSASNEFGREKDMKKYRSIFAGIAAFFASLSASHVAGQGNEYESIDNFLEEVVVTAQKRQQNLQDLGISISAINGNRLNNLGLQDLDDIMALIPGVTFSSVGAGEGHLVIRGVAATPVSSFNKNLKETVGVYIDDTPVANAHYNPDISPFDLERVEVLRGPQGTLYGSGSLSGTVRYITKKPDTKEFASQIGADISVTSGGGTNHRINGMVNLPLSDTLAIRVVGYDEFDDGYIRGVGPVDNGEHENDVDKYGFRLAARWEPSDEFTVDTSAIIQRMERELASYDTENRGYTRGVPVDAYEQYQELDTYATTEIDVYNLTLNYDLGWAELTSSTSYLDRHIKAVEEFNVAIQFLFGIDVPAITPTLTYFEDLSQEIRVVTKFDGPLNFIGGLFYSENNRDFAQDTPAPGFDAAVSDLFGVPFSSVFLGAPEDVIFTERSTIDDRQKAVFGELTYEITDKLSATVGLRWFDAEQETRMSTGGIASNGEPPAKITSDESDINPKFMLSYALNDDVLLSAQAARGFRLGGTNESLPSFCTGDLAALNLSSSDSFDSESVWNYEINAKTSWLDKRLIVNGAFYNIDYEDIQITSLLNCAFEVVHNGAEATSQGIEFEITAIPVDGLQLTLGGNYSDAELSEDIPSIGATKGDQLPLSSKYSLSAIARYEFPFSDRFGGFVQYNYSYKDEVIFHLNWEGNASTVGQPGPSYDVHNMRFGLNSDKWKASLFVNNMFDEEIITFEDNVFSGAYVTRSRAQPRTVGLSFSAEF